jgi:hypothetical protein
MFAKKSHSWLAVLVAIYLISTGIGFSINYISNGNFKFNNPFLSSEKKEALAGGVPEICGSGYDKSTNNLDLCSLSYLGGSQNDDTKGTGILADKQIIVGGNNSENYNQTPQNLNGGGNGVIYFFSPNGKTVNKVVRVGTNLTALKYVAETNTIYAVSETKLLSINPDNQSLNWSKEIGSNTVQMIAANSNYITTVVGNKVTLFDKSGTEVKNFTVGIKTISGLEVDTTGKTYIAGYTQKDGGGCSQYKSPYLASFDTSGTQVWKNYDWTHAQVFDTGNCADSRVDNLFIKNGKLYMTGWTDGGNSVFRSNPRDLSKTVTNVVIDKYNETWGMSGAKSIAYFAKLDLNTGNHELGQFLLSRMDNNSGNSVGIKSLFVDNNENIYLGGSAYYKMGDNRDTKKINNQLVGAYGGGDAYIYKVNSTMNQRLMWHTWTATSTVSSANEVNGIYERDGLFTFAGTTNGGDILTVQAIQSSKGSLKEAFFGVWGDVNVQTTISSSSSITSIQNSSLSNNSSTISSSNSNNSSLTSQNSSTVNSASSFSSLSSDITSSNNSISSQVSSTVSSISSPISTPTSSNPYFLPMLGNNGEQYISMIPTRGGNTRYNSENLVITVQNYQYLKEGADCKIMIRNVNKGGNFGNWIDITGTNNKYTNGKCQPATLDKNLQATQNYEIQVRVKNPSTGDYANFEFGADVDYSFSLGALSLVTVGVVQ